MAVGQTCVGPAGQVDVYRRESEILRAPAGGHVPSQRVCHRDGPEALPSSQRVGAEVGRDDAQPGEEASVATECRQRAPCTEEGFLRHVLSFMGISQPAEAVPLQAAE